MAQGKRLKAAAAKVDRTKSYPLTDAIKLVKSNATAKFDETVELSMNFGIDPRHADQMVRGLVGLPNGTGKTLRVAVFARGAEGGGGPGGRGEWWAPRILPSGCRRATFRSIAASRRRT